ncbi:ATP-binding protein [Chlorogloeopsis sp. ULAP01]|uniref:hybrid sensor histidine kinase/response regulator n=1 Tax=Chlorogloeopsis sp. ULAP01 TaxID=3056483 RepID=UPI0025AB4AC4|nr:ATP-binding protein [Chlorogloeopsis sp. ULAP01]MDM9381316.1 ATP-binding protein [Chlorogloeopsis sp. ULAP01]
MSDAWTILIIDDSAADRKIYRRYLLKDAQQSYQILEADCGEDGLALCQKIQCNLMLLDFCLPDMSGLEFLDRLKQQRLEISIPVIMLTGRGDEEIAVQAMKKGVQDYLVKQNLTQDVLQLAVRNTIKQSYLQTQLQKTQERQRLIAMTALRIRQSLDLEQILHTAVTEVQQLLKCDRVMVYQFLPDQSIEMIACSSQSQMASDGKNIENIYFEVERSWNELATNASNPHSQSSKNCQQVESDSTICCICQYAIIKTNEANWNHNCSNLLELSNSGANQVVPITLSNNEQLKRKPWGFLMACQCSSNQHWQSDELEILHQVSVQLAIAIQQAELLAKTQAALVKEKQLNTFKSQIITTISHEYRTPLASILASASTLKQNKDKLDEFKQQRFLEIIEQKTRHLSKLVDDMLVIDQLELDKAKFKPILLDLRQLFSDLLEEQRLTASDRHELIFRNTGNHQGFWGDRGLLRLIFSNLISNAIKYSPQGGNVEFHLINKNSQVVFYVQDEGIGIPIQDRANLFQSFSRGSNVDTIPGTGLGLAITKACVELHGGSIALESQIGQGTKVIVSLPNQLSKNLAIPSLHS